jgi:hypothetical protein
MLHEILGMSETGSNFECKYALFNSVIVLSLKIITKLVD